MHNIHSALLLLKHCTMSKIIITPSFQRKALGRAYHDGLIKNTFCTQKIFGITDQENDTFKLLYQHTTENDLCIACRIQADHIIPITIYPSKRSKRIRNDEH
ncbi:hypothetical protein C4580_05445 [Candidatus Woesearchaeota archaeon]|nr:MAG: hypothetical protein C4580_05445 [Candidatus Woesearchaeota archaeon]